MSLPLVHLSPDGVGAVRAGDAPCAQCEPALNGSDTAGIETSDVHAPHQWVRLDDGHGFTLAVHAGSLTGGAQERTRALIVEVLTRPSEALAHAHAIAQDPALWLVDLTKDDQTVALRAASALAWALAGYPPDVAGRWREEGFEAPTVVGPWIDAGFTPAQVERWVAAALFATGIDADPADLSVVPPEAVAFRDHQAWKFVQDDPGFPAEPQWGALWKVTSRAFAAIGYAQGRSPAMIERLSVAVEHAVSGGPTGTTTVKDGHWTRVGDAAYCAAARQFDGLDWDDAALCLTVGMSVEETVEHLRCGRDMEPVRVTAALLDPDRGLDR